VVLRFEHRTSCLLSRCSAQELTPPALFHVGHFWDRVLWSVSLGWSWTMILLISASRVARITGMSHQQNWFSCWGLMLYPTVWQSQGSEEVDGPMAGMAHIPWRTLWLRQTFVERRKATPEADQFPWSPGSVTFDKWPNFSVPQCVSLKAEVTVRVQCCSLCVCALFIFGWIYNFFVCKMAMTAITLPDCCEN
jgi:hypothetical protein